MCSNLSRTLLLLLVSAQAVFSGQNCPASCDCVWYGGSRSADCSSLGLEMVPILEDDGKGTVTSPVTVGKFSHNNELRLDDQLSLYGYRDFQELYFKMCNIEHVMKHIFRGLYNLSVLDLSSNRISRIEDGSFDDLRHLKTLVLSSNELTSLDYRSLITLPNLETLDLSLNLLSVLMIPGLYREEKSNSSLAKLSRIYLEGNPWRCDCHLGPLHRDLEARGLLREEVKCSEESGGGHWIEMAPNNFSCSPFLTRMSPPQRVHSGEGLTLYCEFQGNPRPGIFWKVAGGEVFKEDEGVAVFEVDDRSTEFLRVARSNLSLSGLTSAEDVDCCGLNTKGQLCQTVRVSLSSALHQVNPGLVVGVSLFGLLLLGLFIAGVLVYTLRRRKLLKKTKNASSFELLNSSLTLPPMKKDHLNSPVNPLPKPPRTGLYGDAFSRMSLSTIADDSQVMLTGQDELNSNYMPSPHMMFSRPQQSDTASSFVSWLDNRPGSRASIVTISSVVSSPPVDISTELPHHLLPLLHSHSHPPYPAQPRPGYVTLPRKAKPRSQLDCLGPRTSADGSSHTNINKITLHGVKFSPSQPAVLEERANSVAVAADVEVRAESPLQQRSLLDPILEQELE